MTSALTVIVLNDYCHINGGASRVAIDEAVGLAVHGVNVIFFGAAGPIGSGLKTAPLRVICLEQSDLIKAAQSPSALMQGLWNFTAYKALQTLLAELDPHNTIIHLHGYTKALTSSPVRCAVDHGFPAICTLHDFFIACPNGAFFNYRERTPCAKRGLSADCIATDCDKRHYSHKLYRVGRSLIQRGPGYLPKGIRDYIVLSQRSAELLRPYLPANARLHALENIVDTTKGPPIDVAGNSAIVAVGRLDVEKGIEILLDAARLTGMKLTLIGDGPLRSRAENEGHRVTGWLSPEQVQNELTHARCLVFPSLWYEAYGLVVAEAAARGIPAIVSDICAAAERIEHNVNGWHARTGDADDLACYLRLVADHDTVRTAGCAAYDRFWAAPPVRDNHISSLLKIYENMLGKDINATQKTARVLP